ncbi:MAG: phosphate ABC transporter substrate-binding protein [Syntrophobacteraceae bacterium]
MDTILKASGRLYQFFGTLLLVALVGANAAAGEIVARGSDSTISVVQALVEAYKAKTGTAIKVEGGGSSKGAKDCLAGEVDLAFMSREPKDDETKAGLVGVPYAIDGVAVIVNKANPINDLTLEQLKAIYTGNMKQWTDGKPILALTRATTSGTREVFQERVLGKAEFDPSLQIKHDKAAIDTVSKAITAVAYTSVGELADSGTVKVVTVNKATPSPATLRDKSYPISRTLHFATKGEAKADIKPFLEFVVSDDGQKVVKKVGFVPLRELKD